MWAAGAKPPCVDLLYVPLQDMSGSQVSGGFWCQAPRALSDHWAHLTSVCEITVHCEDAVYPLASFAYNSEGERSWDMVWLPRPKSGAGFSGRWRAFAIDQVRGGG